MNQASMMSVSRRFIKMELLVILVVVSFVSATMAKTVLFQDNFESDKAGTHPTSKDLDPVIGARDVGGVWSIEETTPDLVQVLNKKAIGGTDCLSIKRTAQGYGNVCATGWDKAKTEDIVQLDMDIYIPSDSKRSVIVLSAGPKEWDNVGPAVLFGGDGVIKISFGNGGTFDTDLKSIPDTWQHVRFLINVPDRMYELTVGDMSQDHFLFKDMTPTNFQWLGIQNSADSSQIYVDNISLKAIEPVAPRPTAALTKSEPVDIGSRRELFVDGYLIDSISGDVRLQLHQPTRREIVFKTDKPWEGNAVGFGSVFKDGDLYRMYYGAGNWYPDGSATGWPLCYIESDDGINWRRPLLSLYPHEGKYLNNMVAPHGCEAAVFKDENPDCPPDQKYKIVSTTHDPFGLYFRGSPDGIHFSEIEDRKMFITTGQLDSQNLVFWDSVAGMYREYHRVAINVPADEYRKEVTMRGRSPVGDTKTSRSARTSTAKTIFGFPEPKMVSEPRNWPKTNQLTQGELIEFPGAPTEEMYMPNIQPYYRAPHIFIGFPGRYTNRGWSEPMHDLPGQEDRLVRAEAATWGEFGRWGFAITDAMFMSSRDGVNFNRWKEAFLRPGPREKDSWVYGDNFIFWGMVETQSTIENAPNEISLYAIEGFWQGNSTSIRRLSLRLDGFVSAHALWAGGEIITKPIRFEGGNLTLNLETSAAGSVQVEILDIDGKPIEGYTLADCPTIFCDRIAKVVRWSKKGGDVRPLAGKPIRLRFVLKDADLYSFQFVPYAPDPQRPTIKLK